MKKGISFLGLIQAIAVLYLIVWSVSPPLEIDLIYRLLALSLAAVWAVIAFMRRIQLDNIHIWAAVFIVLVVITAYFETKSFSGIIKQIALYMLFVEFIIFSFYSKKNLWHEIDFIIPVVLILLLYFNINTVKALIEDPTIARIIVRNEETANNYLRQGIGGYALVYTQTLFFPVALMWLLKAFDKNKIKFFIGLAWLVSYGFLIANAGYSIAIFSTLASAFVLFFYKGKSVVGVVIITMALFIGAMAAILYVAPLREWLLTVFDGTAVAKKINDLVSTSESGSAEGSIQSRITAYMASLRALLRYPVIGSLWDSGGAGGHSAVLDNFVKYGWWGGYIYSKLVFYVPNKYKKDYKSRSMTSLINAELVVMIFISFLDTLPYQLMCSFMIIVPLLIQDIIKWTGEKNESSLVG